MTSTISLYKPEKYHVHLGLGHAGFCTVWNSVNKAMEECPGLTVRCAIIGTLYGANPGVSIIIRNLAKNPSIRRLYLWGHGALSNTPYGVLGTSVLKALWKNGVNDDGSVTESKFKFPPEIDAATVRKIISSVELIDVSDKELHQAVDEIPLEATEPYMDPVDFPEPKQAQVRQFPSELVGLSVHGKNIVDAWLQVVQLIMRYGALKGTQYGSQQRELISVNWVSEHDNPDAPEFPSDWPDELRSIIGANNESVLQYHKVITSPEVQPGVAYTYGQRLRAYPGIDGKVVDQVAAAIIKGLKSSPDCRRTAITTLYPPVDAESKEPPCLVVVQCLQTHGKLHLMATFRSHDIFGAAIANAYGLRKLQQIICNETGFEMGKLQITSESAHIYETGWDHAAKLINCSFGEREPRLSFDPQNADPRGNCIITVKGSDINFALMSPDGEELLSLSSPSARFISAKIAQLNLLSRPDHLLYVGSELERAELSIKLGMKYVQDQPLQ